MNDVSQKAESAFDPVAGKIHCLIHTFTPDGVAWKDVTCYSRWGLAGAVPDFAAGSYAGHDGDLWAKVKINNW